MQVKNEMNSQTKKCKESDTEYQTYILEKVIDHKNKWELKFNGGTYLYVKKIKNFIPTENMSIKIYGKGFGYPVRGVEINGNIFYYLTPAQQEKKHKKMCIEMDKRDKNNFIKNKKSLDKKYNSLPQCFKERIDGFRKNNKDFRWKFEAYEMFCCQEAIKIAEYFKSPKKIMDWKNKKYTPMPKCIDEGHSGNTFGCAVVLAYNYLLNPQNVNRIHGALSPLVGSKEYGDIKK